MDSDTPRKLEPGEYVALLVECRPHLSEHGPAVMLVFDVNGNRVSRCIGTRCTNGNAAGRMVAALLGRQMEPGKGIDLRPLINKQYRITVERPSNGGVRVADNPPPTPHL
jgi:hypothetical protein